VSELTRTIAVYCSARDGLAPPFIDAAHELGRSLAERGAAIVYGGGGRGLMGEIARASLAAEGHVIGVIPRSMVEREAAHNGVTEQVIIDTMHQRKQIMADRCDAYIAMPGGVGTLDEIFEAITWHQLDLHAKPMIFLDIDGYYSPLKQFLEHSAELGFIPVSTMDAIGFETTVPGVLEALKIE
jgi:uncharacterized protein (TIGR00730 family)